MTMRDYRWPLLLMLALFLFLFDLRNESWQSILQRKSINKLTKSWREMCLLWDCAGPKGAGVYGRDQGGNTAVNPQLVSPRLAIFTFLRFDLNQVDADTLQIIKGIGPKLASAIVDYRVVHGPFHSVEELLAVRGIGPTKLISLRAHVMLPLIP